MILKPDPVEFVPNLVINMPKSGHSLPYRQIRLANRSTSEMAREPFDAGADAVSSSGGSLGMGSGDICPLKPEK